MKIGMFVMSLLLVIGAVIGIATASVNPFNVPEGFNAWPNVTAPTWLPGLNPFGPYNIVIPTPTEYDPGVRWERPVRTDWINQTSITSGMNSLTFVVDRSSLISNRLSQLL
jgi:hypothetical protein